MPQQILIVRIVAALFVLYTVLSFRWPALTFLFRLKPGIQKAMGIPDEVNRKIGRVILTIIGFLAFVVLIVSFFISPSAN